MAGSLPISCTSHASTPRSVRPGSSPVPSLITPAVPMHRTVRRTTGYNSLSTSGCSTPLPIGLWAVTQGSPQSGRTPSAYTPMTCKPRCSRWINCCAWRRASLCSSPRRGCGPQRTVACPASPSPAPPMPRCCARCARCLPRPRAPTLRRRQTPSPQRHRR